MENRSSLSIVMLVFLDVAVVIWKHNHQYDGFKLVLHLTCNWCANLIKRLNICRLSLYFLLGFQL